MLDRDTGADRTSLGALRIERHGGDSLRGLDSAPGDNTREARFGKLFPELSSRGNVAPSPEQLGLPDGPMDGGSDHQDSTSLPAILTYFGQFLDHDITFDPTSSLEREQDPTAVRNFRTPMLELDSVYGAGRVASPFLYDREQPNKMLLGKATNHPDLIDLPRNPQGVALIGDPRNDENLIIAQLHVAFLKFHNAIVDQLSEIDDGVGDRGLAKAQRLVRWHYQWLVLHEFLPAIVGRSTLDDVLNQGRKLYQPRYPFIPVEFSVAAYRFGHSMVQPGYAINDVFGARLFPAHRGALATAPRSDLRGGPIRFEERVNWKNFVDTGAPVTPASKATRFSSKINTRLSGPLLNLPISTFAEPQTATPASLAVRNLARGIALGLPSGQDVANAVSQKCGNLRKLTDDELWDQPKTAAFKGQPAPLWFYLLREAEVLGQGEQLGPIGGRIVAEVIIGLLQADLRSAEAPQQATSYLVSNPNWKPQVKGRKDEAAFTFADLFRIAGVDVD